MAPPSRHAPTGPDQALAGIEALTAQLRDLDRQRDIAVHAAVINGATWAQVARALGVTSQAAHKRYRWLHHQPATGATWQEPPLPW